jgi:hypothetical protein
MNWYMCMYTLSFANSMNEYIYTSSSLIINLITYIHENEILDAIISCNDLLCCQRNTMSRRDFGRIKLKSAYPCVGIKYYESLLINH